MQGEGPDAGRPAIFIRLAKCNLRCFFCDTEFNDGVFLDADEVAKSARDLAKPNGTSLVVMTGGEPLLQNIMPASLRMNEYGMGVSVETAGSVYDKRLDSVFKETQNRIVCSPKTIQINKDIISLVHAWKYIVRAGHVSDVDGLPMESTQTEGVVQQLYRPKKDHPAPIYVQPMDEGDPEKNAANVKLAGDLVMRYGYRLSLQMHKIVGLP